MTIKDNTTIVHKWIDAWLKKDLDSIDELFAQNYTVNGVLIGPQGVKQAVEFFHSALANLSAELNEIVAEDDKVVARWTVRGIHVSEFVGVPSTGKQLELKGINIYRVMDGKIIENHEQTNILEVIQSLKTND